MCYGFINAPTNRKNVHDDLFIRSSEIGCLLCARSQLLVRRRRTSNRWKHLIPGGTSLFMWKLRKTRNPNTDMFSEPFQQFSWNKTMELFVLKTPRVQPFKSRGFRVVRYCVWIKTCLNLKTPLLCQLAEQEGVQNIRNPPSFNLWRQISFAKGTLSTLAIYLAMKTNLVIDALFHTTEELPLCKSFFPCGVRESINLVFRTADEKVFQKSLCVLTRRKRN